jgi:lipopolysaccharide transport system permease protein
MTSPTPSSNGAGSAAVLRLEAPKGLLGPDLGELWTYREMLYFLVWREVKVRYKQTALGAAWAILQPLFTMLVFSIFFGRLAKMPSDGVPYPLFAFAALVPWMFFANALTQSANSLVNSANLVTKTYFPRLIIPLASIVCGLVDFALSFLLLLGFMFYYGVSPNWKIVWVPFFLLLAFVTALGVGLWLSALNVQFRDVRHTLPFLTQFWMFGTPIAYPSSLLPAHLQALFGLNPMAGVVEGFRWALLGSSTRPGPMIVVSCFVALFLLVTGAYYFRRLETQFADII